MSIGGEPHGVGDGVDVGVGVGVGVGGVGHASAVVLMDLIAEGGP